MAEYKTQIAIIGGGICGLWLLDALTRAGHDALLLERDRLGSQQTLASQGMIHGGIKYALGGFATAASETIAGMPARWSDCLAGKAAPDLSGVRLLSRDYYLFSDSSLSSRVTAFFGSRSIRGRVQPLPRAAFPAFFANEAFKGSLYRLQDMVLDTVSLVATLAERGAGRIYRCDPKVCLDDGGTFSLVDIGGDNQLSADTWIFAAGAGNGQLLHDAGIEISTQTRPLRQVMVKSPTLPALYAHGVSLDAGAKPRITITTHPAADGDNVWYLGGQLAETGVARADAEQVAFAAQELAQLFPWLSLAGATWRSFLINRAEPDQAGGGRPDSPYCRAFGNVIVCWPTKLTLTPLLADQLLGVLQSPPQGSANTSLPLPPALPGSPPWEQLF
jgi:glycerol-3-phosphate dehydrogenase